MANGQEGILQALTEIKQEFIDKMDENAEMQLAELHIQVSQLGEDDRMTSLETASLETAANGHSDSITTLERHVLQMKKGNQVTSREQLQFGGFIPSYEFTCGGCESETRGWQAHYRVHGRDATIGTRTG